LTRRWRTRPGVTTIGWAGRTTSPPTVPPGDAIQELFPSIRTAALQNRLFLKRVVRFLAGQTGVRQFLDVGTGLPTAENTHEVAQQIAADSRIVYVDNDPIVMVHARALLTGSPQGRTAYIEADLRDPAALLADDTLRQTLNLSQPVALLLIAVAHFLPDHEQAYTSVKALVDALGPGSFLALSHVTGDLIPQTLERVTAGGYPGSGDTTFRTREQIARFFDGLDLIEPGLRIVSTWRPDPDTALPDEADVSVFGGVARKPSRSAGEHGVRALPSRDQRSGPRSPS
jgi:hypothetical protein